MKLRRAPDLAAILLAAAVCAGPLAEPAAFAQASNAAVGAEGELYVIREGTYGALFPQQGLADAENRVLALEIVRGDEPRQMLLVPGTETADVEDSASILFEDQSGTLFVLWQTRVRSIHSRLVLIGFRGGEWSEPIEISGSPFGWKSSPQLAVTRDSFRTEQRDGTLRTWKRTVAHLLWWEEGVSGKPVALYSPVALLDGDYTGWNPVFSLDGLTIAPKAGVPPWQVNFALAEAPRIVAGRNSQSVVFAFVSGVTGELVSVSAEVLPGEISFIADAIRNQIVDLGRDLRDEPEALAERVRNQIVDLGTRLGLHPSIPSYAALRAADEILGAPADEGLHSLAERIRNQIVDLGSRMTDRGLDRVTAAQKLSVVETSNGESSGAPVNLIRLVEASSRPAPATGEVDLALFLSRNGREIVVSWVEDGAVFFRETRGHGWSEARQLRLGGELDLGRAREILARRADERSDD